VKILLITQEPPLQSADIVSGNAVRTRQLGSALESAGHAVSQAWLSADRKRTRDSFRNHDELKSILMERRPDALIVSYWELLALLPYDMPQIVILDFVAPRPLEEMFESPQTVRGSMRRLRLNLERCDLVLVGNEPQRQLLNNTLIEAGFDLRESYPAMVVPLGAEALDPPRSNPGKDGWLLVGGGVTWPWRNPGAYTEALEKLVGEMRPTLRMVHFGGPYRWHENNSNSGQDITADEQFAIEYRPLAPYRQFSHFLSENAHIGVELSEWNSERQYSQSFRSLEYLRHGLPLLCNDFLPLARLVEQYDAGWTVQEPESLRPLLERVIGQPGEWQRKSDNALRLVSKELAPAHSVQPLLQWLKSPRKADRLPELPRGRKSEPVLGVPPLGQRLKRQFSLIRQVLLGRLYGREKGQGVLFVTRGDLFPADHGAAVRTVETARALSRRGLPVGIVTDERKYWYSLNNGKEEKVAYPLWVRLLSLPGPLVKLLHFSKDLPFSNSFLYLPLTDRGFQWRAIAAAKQIAPAILQAEFPAYVQPCLRLREALDCAVVLVEHNVEYDRIRTQVDELSEAQYENLKSIEIAMCRSADSVVCVSDNDRQKLVMDGADPSLMHTIPHGVNLQQYEEGAVADGRERFGIPTDSPVLVYHGTFSYPPNREALQIFAEILLPELESRGLICHVLAVGKSPPANTPHERIHFTGSVDRVAPWLKTADMAVIPLTDGGGTRMKIIDCFAASLPLISTSKGIEGIPAVPGQHALVLDEWDSMADAICELWANPEKARELARGGREMAESLDWNSIADKFVSLYASLG
jgi:glycosyltransferase involved in cell wall biosynthesis